jgi:uncharacterized protein (TIGR01244 family)
MAAIVIALPLFIASPAHSETPTTELGIDLDGTPAEVEDFEGIERALYRDGRVLIGGQPDEQALERLQELGVTAVVNLRTPGEMNDRERVPYDEAAAVQELGMEYVWIPLGGDDHPYTAAAVDRITKTLAKHDGPVLLHCTMGWRASYLWVAYLVRERGMELQAALARGTAIAIPPSPLEGLLDRKLTLSYAD